ncbi:SpoIIE family protein phosphatase [Marichromatium gracile]|uniref:PP2C family protein-serine/threonine phosphatase n=1 Tax=Marichromatium gracile TaxID=1048 RepID=UPI001F26D804|nr:SpoIIE family protein phosphatase [Marichromatium gracile]MCF1182287.1 SpoIIE family protein phosphatase [Marichromatium gracile]
MRRPSIAARLSLIVSLYTSAILLAVLGVDYLRSLATLEAEIDRGARLQTEATANALEIPLSAAARTAHALAAALNHGHFDDAGARELLRQGIADNRDVLGGALLFAPSPTGTPRPRDHDCRWRGTEVECLDGREVERGPTDTPLPHPAPVDGLSWSPPYFDDDLGQARMVTLSAAFDGGRVSLDLNLDRLTREVAALRLLDSGHAALLDAGGTFITHPLAGLALRRDIHAVPEALGLDHHPERAAELLSGHPGVIDGVDVSGDPIRLYHAPVAPPGWTLVVVLPAEEIDDDVRALALTTSAIGLLGLALMLLAITLSARAITRPLRRLVAATREVAAGRLDTPLPLHPRDDEIGDLTAGFATMTRSLRDHIERLTASTAAQARIASELHIAHDIQLSILPRRLAPHPAFDLHALVEPAREVGGDFYDCFALDADHHCLVIADVAGKGVPAALFMAVAKTLVKAASAPGRGPAEVLERVNAELARDNPRCMFVTLFCAVLDHRSGELIHSNAGHNPPLLLRAAGEIEPLPSQGQLVLGVMEGAHYRDARARLAPGDRLLLYTDGVTEAMDADAGLYGEARLREALRALGPGSAQTLVEGILDEVHAFAGDTPQADDITLMALAYRGPGAPGGD